MSNEVRTKRAAKRYPYSCDAQCHVDGQVIEVQMLNISRSGIQFAARSQIKSTSPIKILWQDTEFGTLDPTLLIAREIHKPENKRFQYYYGSQYYNLNDDVKANLLLFLKKIKEEAKNEAKKEIEKITPKYLMDIIEQESSFLKRVFDGKKVPACFDNLIKDIKDYEKLSFTTDDQVSLCIQKLTTHNFHFNLFGILTPLMIENFELQSNYFRHIYTELQKISETETEVETVIKKTMESEDRDEDKKNNQKLLNESSNRFFYTKQGLLQSVVETFSGFDPDSDIFKDSFGKIKEEYERIAAFSNSSVQNEAQLYNHRTKKQDEYSKADAIIDVQVTPEVKPRYFLWFNVFFLIVFSFGFVIHKITVVQNTGALEDQIGIEIDIKEYDRTGSQINITVHYDEWEKLPPTNKQDTYEKIIQFLKKDKNARSCMIFSSNGRLIKILYKDTE
jgi:hypothetical protein